MSTQLALHRRLLGTSRGQLFVWLSLVTLCGCGDSAEAPHLEHLIPAHKPESLATAVTELRRRGAETYAETYAGGVTGEESAQLADIITWLPELAADSDARRAQWERIQSISRELAELQKSAPADGSQRWRELVDELDDLARAAGAATSESTVAGDDPAQGADLVETQGQP